MNRALIFLALLLLAGAGRAADLDADSELGRWLDDRAGPELAEVLARHPRFSGETLAFVAVVDGAPSDASDALHEAVERRLRRHLLRTEGVRLALPFAGDACAPGARPALLVGIEIVARGGRSASVALGLIDAVEGVWISGVAHDWRGALSADERRALGTPGAGSTAALRALPLADADAVAEALAERLRCAWPGGLGGRVHLAAAPDAADAPRIAAALRGRLGRGPSVLVADPDRADWRLVLNVDGTGGAREARLLLAPSGEAPGQQLASVFVTGPGDAVAAATASQALPATTPRATPAATDTPTRIPTTIGAATGRSGDRGPELVAVPRLEQVDREGLCRDAGREELCAELAVELEQPAWLFLFSTRDGQVRPLACDSTPERSEAGERRFRFTVGAAETRGRPDTGIYVLAARERDLARDLARTLRRAPGACGTRDSRPLEHWLETIADLLARHPEDIAWHAVHLVRDGDRVIRIQERR